MNCPQCHTTTLDGSRFCPACGYSLGEESIPPSPSAQHSPGLPVSFAAGRYQVRRFLGEGGKKRVYLAHDSRLDRDVAIALIKTEGLDAEGLTRVRREAQAMGRLGDHPHIVTIYDITDEAGQPCMVSQYMAGGSVEEMLQRVEQHRLPMDQALCIGDQVCQALEHAHGHGIIHRDLKPGNVWLGADGAAALGDFGLAVALDRSRLTLAGMMVGTVAYMAPEQALGRPPDARSDLYALGAMLYEMVTGRPPFLGDDVVAIVSQHINTAPVAPCWHNPEVPRALEALILRLLAKAPEERPDNAAAVRQALAAISSTASTVGERAVQEEANSLDRLAGGIFVGREKEMDELRAGLEDTLSGRGRLLMLVGEPGIGKTRTADELATYARLRNAQVLWGRCYEGQGAPSYWPWVQVIRSYVHDRDPNTFMSEMGPGAADIAQVVSEVRERLPGLPAPPPLEPEQARFHLFDSITTFLKNAGKRQPIVLVLDDLHWADKPSLLLLQFLARELRGARLLVVGTYRDVGLGRQHPLAQTLAELTREQLSHRILLRGLSERDVARFIEITAGLKPPQALVAAVFKESEGNPFFVNEIVRLLVTDGRLERHEEVKSWSVTIPQSVREVVGRRLDHLSEECNGVLAVAAVIGREFGLDALEQVSDLAGDRLLEALEEAVAARVITEVPRAVGRYSFSHALIRETLYEELTTTRRVRLHGQVGEVLERLYGTNPEAHLAELAYHFFEAAQAGHVEKAIDYSVRAAERATRLLAYEDAVNDYERALQALELQEPPDETRRCQLLLGVGEASWRAGEFARAKQAFLQAAAVARELGAPEQLARAALGLGGRMAGFEAAVVDEALIGLLEQALGVLPEGDSRLRARVLGRLAEALTFAAPLERRRSLSVQAVEIARRIGDPAVLAATLVNMYWATWGPANTKERAATAVEIIRLAESVGDREMALQGRIWHMVALVDLGDVRAARQEHDVCSSLADEIRQPYLRWVMQAFTGLLALHDGRLHEVEELAQKALAVGQQAENQNAATLFGTQMAILRLEQGRLQELEPALKAFVQQYPAAPAWGCALALLYADSGRREEARAELEALAANNFADLPEDMSWLPGIALLSWVCALIQDAAYAERLYEMLRPHAGANIALVLAVPLRSASHCLGLLAAILGRWEEASRHFEDALEEYARTGCRLYHPWALFDYASMLLARSEPGDRERALALSSQALDSARDLGMAVLLKRALALKVQAQGIGPTGIKTSIDVVASAVEAERPDLQRHAAPDGTVTILFTDIEGSTAMTERLGDQRWLEILRTHNAIIRKQVAAHRGFEVKSQGDGFMLAFQSARRALQCAIDIQRAFAQQNQAAEETMRVRIGLHTGEAIKEADDFFGKNVILAARIASQAQGGQILVSSLLKELTESAGDMRFDNGREVELKGLSGTRQAFQVMWE